MISRQEFENFFTAIAQVGEHIHFARESAKRGSFDLGAAMDSMFSETDALRFQRMKEDRHGSRK